MQGSYRVLNSGRESDLWPKQEYSSLSDPRWTYSWCEFRQNYISLHSIAFGRPFARNHRHNYHHHISSPPPPPRSSTHHYHPHHHHHHHQSLSFIIYHTLSLVQRLPAGSVFHFHSSWAPPVLRAPRRQLTLSQYCDVFSYPDLIVS